MTQADKLVRLTQQLVGDISRLPGVVLDSGGEAQLVQLITDAFEQVGLVALNEWEEVNKPAVNVPRDTQVTAHPGDIIT